MSELAFRVLAVALIILGAGAVAWAQRRPRRARRRGAGPSLEPGVYLFSSKSCLECDPARDRLSERLGPNGFVEIAWESDRVIFEEAGVEAVPTTIVVAEGGEVTIIEGVPGPVLDSFSP